ncbi:nitroreductase [Brevibacterium sp. NPDC049920]|uniref:nitroreductase n=1 Tax=Brevibacterium sp. NPDC049920 TaxID=3155279 RepID=UPI0025DD1C00|nr:nitroreductase [uncultured Brevibacterium sp.]
MTSTDCSTGGGASAAAPADASSAVPEAPARPGADGRGRSFRTLLAERYSVRHFTGEPVIEEQLTAVLATAQRTPSWSNTQAWQVHVLTDEVLREIGRRLRAAVTARTQQKTVVSDLALPGRFTEEQMHRKRVTGYGRYESLGIDRKDRVGRFEASLANFEFFGAPVGLVITSTREVGPYGWVDTGAYIGTLQYAAWEAGLGACALGSIGMHADLIHRYLGLADDVDVIAGMALGHPDHAAPGNTYRTERAPLSEVVHRVETLND